MKAEHLEQCEDSPNMCQRISCNRTYAMGFGIIAVMMYHAGWFGYGHWGVDLFMFVSGFGIYFSLNNSTKVNIPFFYKKRLLRIMPAACISGFLIGLINYFFNDIAFHNFKLPYGADFIMWGCGLHLWYIRSILIIYFISPFVFYSIKGNSVVQKVIIIFMLLLALHCITIYLGRYISPSMSVLYTMSLSWTFNRFPAFLTGMIIAGYGRFFHIKHKRELTIAFLCLIMAVFLKLYHIPYIPSRCNQSVVCIFIIPPVVVFCIYLDIILRHTPELAKKVLFWMGSSSLELYVVHEAIYSIIFKGMDALCNQGILQLFAFTASLPAALLLKVVASSVQRRFSPLN